VGQNLKPANRQTEEVDQQAKMTAIKKIRNFTMAHCYNTDQMVNCSTTWWKQPAATLSK